MKNIRNLLLLLVFITFSLAKAAEREKAPNILYIFTDDQSCRTVSCYP